MLNMRILSAFRIYKSDCLYTFLHFESNFLAMNLIILVIAVLNVAVHGKLASDMDGLFNDMVEVKK